jgi:hypothetical protein
LVTEFLKDDDGKDILDKPRWLSEIFPLYSLDSDLAKSTKRYKVLDPKEKYGGDWAEVLGSPCLIQVVEYEKNDGTTGNAVGSISPPLKGVSVPELVNETKFFDLDAPDLEMFKEMPKWLQTKLTEERHDHAGSKLEELLGNGGGSEEKSTGTTDIDEEDVPV